METNGNVSTLTEVCAAATAIERNDSNNSTTNEQQQMTNILMNPQEIVSNDHEATVLAEDEFGVSDDTILGLATSNDEEDEEVRPGTTTDEGEESLDVLVELMV